jgi:hypothetical protein
MLLRLGSNVQIMDEKTDPLSGPRIHERSQNKPCSDLHELGYYHLEEDRKRVFTERLP